MKAEIQIRCRMMLQRYLKVDGEILSTMMVLKMGYQKGLTLVFVCARVNRLQ